MTSQFGGRVYGGSMTKTKAHTAPDACRLNEVRKETALRRVARSVRKKSSAVQGRAGRAPYFLQPVVH